MFDVSIPQSINHYGFTLILRENAPRHWRNVCFSTHRHKRTLVNVIRHNGAIGIDLDQIRSRETTRGLIITTVLFYRGEIMIRYYADSTRRAEILAVAFIYNRREISTLRGARKRYGAVYSDEKKKKTYIHIYIFNASLLR